MNRPSSHLVTSLLVFATTFLCAVSAALAQRDTVEFKFIPKYYPEASYVAVPPPEVVHSPKIVFPNDPKLQGKEAQVLLKLKVDRQGSVRDANVLKSTDERFNSYAIKYGKEYKFRWPQGWPQELKDQKIIWVSFPIKFTPK